MTNAETYKRIERIELWAKGLYEEAIKMKKELGRVDAPAPRKGKKKLTQEEQAIINKAFIKYQKRHYKTKSVSK